MRYSKKELKDLPVPKEIVIKSLAEYIGLFSKSEFENYIFRGEPTNYHDIIASALRSKEYPFVKMKNEFRREIFHRTGEVSGLIFLGFSKEVACKVAGRMIQFEINEIDDLARSALAELGNMIMGNTATIFSQEKIMVDITPPTIAKGNMKFDTKEVEHILVPIILGGSTIEMHIAIRK